MYERSPSRGASISGRVFLSDGRAAAGLPILLYGRGFGGTATLFADAWTDGDGFYKIAPWDGRIGGGVELRTVGDDSKEIVLTKTIYDLEEGGVLNLVAPSEVRPLDSEFARLSEDLEREIEDLSLLADAQEKGDQRDLTLLRQGTGWDARVVALAAHASAVEKETGLPAEMLYGLFRAGLPSDPAKLALVPPEVVGKALAKAGEAGVVKPSRSAAKRARASFEEFARKARLQATALVGGSSVGELLDRSPVSGEERDAFEKAYFQHRDEPAQLWKRARDNGVTKKGIERLQLQGKLAYLTLNNAPLTEALQKELRTGELEQLVDMGLYEAAAWKKKLEPTAGKGPAYAVPDAYTGASPEQRLEAYAADLARQVRLSFPTQVVGDMVEQGKLPLTEESEKVRKSVAQFLKQAPAQGFELGKTPVERFVRESGRKAMRRVTSSSQQEAVVGTVKTIQRLYQITPSDHALGVLLEHGFTSADDVLKFHPDDFIDRYGSFFRPGEDLLVSTKAQQVGAVSYTFYGAAKEIESTGGPFVMAPEGGAAEAKGELLKQYPTLEGLFGSLDFCECESCRSVLSPAAYLVDLLQFVNPDDLLWQSFVADWNSKHPKDKYEGAKHLHPYEALKARRPDIADLPLTCENTNTALPYIDVVNEILEHFIAGGAPVAHDTGDARSEELLAEPQNTLANAYGKLQEARYPLALPFDLWTETVRRFFDQFELPLWRALEIFRPSDDLFPPKSGTKAPYYRASVFFEQLGLAPAEHELLTDPNLGSKWFELYGFEKGPEAEKELVSAKRLSRRLGVTYKELIELVSGGFVNPRLRSLAILHKLDIDVSAVFRYKGHSAYPKFSAAEKEAFEKRLAALDQEYAGSKFDAKKWLNDAYAAGDFNKVVVLADPDAGGCDFEKTKIRYADGSPADSVVFLKLNVLVRLWRRLGWSLEETDRALQVLVPAAQQSSAKELPAGLRTALVYMAHLKTLAERVPVGKRGRLGLLTLWSPLPTSGREPLYAKLFLTRSIVKNDPAFDHPLGEYLSQKEVPVEDHLISLQGALGLTAEEVEEILDDTGQPLQGAKLSLPLVSALYRYRLLSSGLKISVRELIALKGMTGLDPFKALDPAPLDSLEKDHPFEATLAFVDAAEAVRDSGFSIEDLEYLLRHRADPVGEHRPDPAAALALVRTLGSEIQRIRSEHAVPSDPATFTDEVLGQKLALIYPPEVTDTFLAMWSGTIVYEAFEKEVKPGKELVAADFADKPEIEVSYDEKAEVQRLAYRGVLLEAKRKKLEEENPSPLLAKLLPAVEAEAKAFFKRELVDFSGLKAFEEVFAPPAKANPEKSLLARRELLAKTLLPFLQEQLIRRLTVQTLAIELDLDPATVEPLITDTRLLVDPTSSKASLVEAFAAADERGVGVEDLGAKGKRLSGVLEVPATGTYSFYAVAEAKTAEVELRFDHLPDPVLVGLVDEAGELGGLVELAAGTPYAFSFLARELGGKDVSLLVQAERLSRGPISRLDMVPTAVVERVGRARTLLAKVGMLITALGLGERELRHFVSHPADFDELDLNALPTVEDDGLEPAEAAAAAKTLFGQFERLAAYAKLKRELEAEPDGFVEVWEHARRVHPKTVTEAEAIAEVEGKVYGRIATLTRRDPETVAQTARELGMKISSKEDKGKGIRVTEAGDLVDERGLRRLWEALVAVELLGAPAASVAKWTKVVSGKPADQEEIARDLRNVTKARYEPEAWQRVARPVFDALRQRQRDALVAYIMDSKGFDRIEQLFEYFLVDPGMEPVVQTSRIQLAIASVQLFVQRCLLNLEPGVHPRALVNARHWSWMKRYRVWEANRKLFLYPENWLEPEFRDDKSNLFGELEGALMEGDITEELAENAFFGYLKGLEKLARLDVVSTYVEEKPNPVDNVLHVIGRTHSLPHEYFYRRYAHQVWMPWEPIEAEIESDHVAAVVWRERLHVFWVTFMEQAQNSPPAGESIKGFAEKSASFAPGKKVEIQLHWTERFQDAWTTREAGAQGEPVTVGGSSFNPAKALIHVSKEFDGEREGALRIHLGGAIGRTFRLASKNSAPTVGPGVADPSHPYTPSHVEATRYRGDKQLGVDFTQKITTEKGSAPKTETVHQKIASLPGRFQMLRPSQPLRLPNAEVDAAHVAALVSPFFISDSQHTFYVEPKLHQQTFNVTEKYGYEYEPVDPGGGGVGWVPELPIIPVIPEDLIVIEPRPPWEVDPLEDPDPEVLISPETIFEVEKKPDWTTDPGTVVVFDGGLVGGDGLLEGPALVDKMAIVGGAGAGVTVLESMAFKGDLGFVGGGFG